MLLLGLLQTKCDCAGRSPTPYTEHYADDLPPNEVPVPTKHNKQYAKNTQYRRWSQHSLPPFLYACP